MKLSSRRGRVDGKGGLIPERIVMFGLFGQHNIGNDCTLQAMIHHTRKNFPEAEIVCVCTGPEETSVRYGIRSFGMSAESGKAGSGSSIIPLRFVTKFIGKLWRELRHVVRAIRFIGGSDLFIVPGTGLLVDHTTGFRGFPFYLFKWTHIARLCRCRILVVSIGAGPIHHPISKFLIRRALSLAEYRSYRDTYSKEYLERIGFIRRDDPIYPDLAFSLPESIFPRSENGPTSRTVVGVGLIDYQGRGGETAEERRGIYRAYLAQTGRFVSWLLDHDYDVRILIGDFAFDMSAKRDLLELLGTRGERPPQGRIISEDITSLEQLLTQLGETDIVVSPRYHNIILALMLKKRVISLSYNEKFEYLMLDFGLAQYCQRLSDLDVGSLISKLGAIEEDERGLVLRIGTKIEECRAALDAQYQRIFGNRAGS